MRLRELDPHFIRWSTDNAWYYCRKFDHAQGISFRCPTYTGKPDYLHNVIVPFANRGLDPEKHKLQWDVTGKSFDDLSTTPSILMKGACEWHGYITNGEVTII